MSMTPWLDQPVMLHSDREAMCMMTPEQCALKFSYWVFWYEADHRFALPTVAFFMVAIILFALGNLVSSLAPQRLKQTSGWSRLTAVFRVLSYKSWRVGSWNTRSLGTILLGAAGLVFFLAMTLGPRPYYWPNTKDAKYGSSPPIATRTGFMALGCLPFLIVLGAKANPITALTGVSHEKLNIWHNWVAWAMFVLALIHTFPFIVYHQQEGDTAKEWNTGGVWVTGVVALIAQAWLTFMSIPWIRNRYYEFFKGTHFLAAMVFMIFFFFHCDFRMSSWDYFIATAVLYAVCWFYAQFKTYLELGVRHKARLSRETDHTLKVTINTTTEWQPGQHIFLRFLTGGVHMLTAHPFTICSVPQPGNVNQLVFYVRARGGLTGRLMKLAEQQPNKAVPVLLDGPYGGVTSRSIAEFDRSLVVGGGVGAGFTLSLIEDYVRRAGSVKAEKEMKVIVATRDPAMRTWYTEALREIAERHSQTSHVVGLEVHIHETGPEQHGADDVSAGMESPSEKAGVLAQEQNPATESMFIVKFFRGRPALRTEVDALAGQDGVSVGVVVCGPSSMHHDVGSAAADAQQHIISDRKGAREVWFHQETFS
ncbi:ferric reductase family protein [Aspergillus candidus]|uniref:ferric-chelate reductase (NADPH) n=1 Tax=Aspergillus candidus TaxID=41067 RepID=A0A2I2F885_ASPCN|nr:ferric reductase like transmembrane component-domain-containing protein [Aspergillus candidus]PLB36842.1 ferric reductase like transmembrane component-domain-containing protein [Aspergillus candidus]